MPKEFVEYGNSWRRHHPKWEMKTWNEDNIFQLINQDKFDKCKTVSEKSDFLRYELMVRFGGVYIDTDFECLRPIDPLLANTRSFMGTENGEHISVGIIGSVPGESPFSRIVENLRENWNPGSNASVNSGPWFVTKLLGKVTDHDPQRDFTIFPQETFYPISPMRKHYPIDRTRLMSTRPMTYAIHHWSGSWCTQIIPRIFHCVWLGGSMPVGFVRFGHTWLEHHPGWKMKLWSEDNLFPLINQKALRQCNSFSEQSDIIRYEVLSKFGGVYIDTDFECLRNIEPLLSGVDVFAASEKEDIISTGILGATPNHPTINAIIQAIGREPFPRSKNASENTGPLFVSQLLRELKLDSSLMLFPPNYFYPLPFGKTIAPNNSNAIFPHAYAVHHWAASWMGSMIKPPLINSQRRIRRGLRKPKIIPSEAE